MGALWSAFVGGTYEARSPVVGVDQTINLYPERRQQQGSPKQLAFYGTPGLDLLTTAANNAPCRGWFTQNGRTFGVFGSNVTELSGSTLTVLGTIADDTAPVSMTSNGEGGFQVGIVSAGTFTVLDLSTNTLTPVTLPFANASVCAFLDGYTFINEGHSPYVWFSALEDMTTWDALDFFSRTASADNVMSIAVMKDRLWVFGTQTITLFYNSGDADTPFLPYPGTTTQVGLVNPYALTVYADMMYWVGETSTGLRTVFAATEPSPQSLSTPPIDQWLSECSTLDDAEVLVYAQEGHTFVAWTCPSAASDIKTYVYDLREQLWHARADWDSATGSWLRWRARGATRIGQDIIVGDASSGNVYLLSLDTYTNNGDVLRRLRRGPYIADDNQWVFVTELELAMQPGVGLVSGQGSDPEVVLRVSRDYGQTWTSAGPRSIGAMGRYFDRCRWLRIGRTRADRMVLELSMTDPVKCAWLGCWLAADAGTGQL